MRIIKLNADGTRFVEEAETILLGAGLDIERTPGDGIAQLFNTGEGGGTGGSISASQITPGAFGAGNYIMAGTLTLTSLDGWTGISAGGAVRGFLHGNNLGHFGFAHPDAATWAVQAFAGGGWLHGAWRTTGTHEASDFVLL
jgi:hypothetical protein